MAAHGGLQIVVVRTSELNKKWAVCYVQKVLLLQ